MWFALIPRGNLKLSHSWHSSRLQRGLTQGLRSGALAVRTSAPPASAHHHCGTDLKPNSVCARWQPRAAAVRKAAREASGDASQRHPDTAVCPAFSGNRSWRERASPGVGRERGAPFRGSIPGVCLAQGAPRCALWSGVVGPALRPTGAGGGTEDRCLGGVSLAIGASGKGL